MPAYS